MTDDVPGSAEMFRLLTRIDKRLDDMERRSTEREKDFVRVDVFNAQQQADAVQMRGLEGEVHSLTNRFESVATHSEVRKLEDRLTRTEDQRRGDRNLLLASLAFPLLVMLIGAVVASVVAT